MSSAGPESQGWEARRVSLAFRFGEAPVFRISLDLHVPRQHFTEVASMVEPGALPAEVRASAKDGALLRSHPVDAPIPRLRYYGTWIRYCRAQYFRHLIELDRPFSEYLAGFSGKTRSTLQRKVKRFLKSAGSSDPIREYRTPAELKEFYPLAIALSRKTYQARLLDAGLPDDNEFSAQVQKLAARDLVRAYLLFHGARPIAYLYCPAMPGTRILLYRYLGYDPEDATLSPGTVLQYLALQRLFEEGNWKLFDFLEGETQEKRQFATRSVRCADLYHLRRTSRNAAIVLLHMLTESASDAAGALLERAGLKRALKRWLRSTAGGAAGRPRAHPSASPSPQNGEGKGQEEESAGEDTPPGRP